jgi:hypothetical protein
MVVVRPGWTDEADVDEVGVDPGHVRELPRGRIVEQAARVEQAATIEIAEVAAAPEAIPVVGEAQRRDVVRVPAPRHPRRLEVPCERRKLVPRDLADVVLAPARLAGDRIEAVRPRRPRHRAEPAITHAVFACQVVVDGQVGAVEIAHHHSRLPIVRMRGRVVANETLVPVLELIRSAGRGMAGVLLVAQPGVLEMMDAVALAGVLVAEPGREPIDDRCDHPRASGSRACGRRSGSPSSARRCS